MSLGVDWRSRKCHAKPQAFGVVGQISLNLPGQSLGGSVRVALHQFVHQQRRQYVPDQEIAGPGRRFPLGES